MIIMYTGEIHMGHDCDFIKIYNEYYQKIIRYLTGFVGSNEAEDVAQGVFDKIYRNISNFRNESKLSTWIYRIATNSVIDRLRSAEHKRSTLNTEFVEIHNHESENALNSRQHPDTDKMVIRKEMSLCVREFIGHLPSNYRVVLLLSEMEGMTNQEIANILEISLENVKIRLHRARRSLKESLDEGCDFYHNEQNVLACDRKSSQILPEIPK
jgi:RNA polymerase sigma-70 factor, ECF subfamily